MKSVLLRASSIFLVVAFAAACSSESSGGSTDATSEAALNGGVGKVCDTSADCPSGLTCRTDTETWIEHKQCTRACETKTDCTSAYGSHTSCIGANVCVSECLDDADCPARTHCSENGWCEHTGPGSGVPACLGVPTNCASLAKADCAMALGCAAGGSCGGVSTSCSSRFDAYSCTDLDGCRWDYSSSTCSGYASPCGYNTSEYACSSQSGCAWSSSCSGHQLATSCESQSAALCKYALGCSLAPQ